MYAHSHYFSVSAFTFRACARVNVISDAKFGHRPQWKQINIFKIRHNNTTFPENTMKIFIGDVILNSVSFVLIHKIFFFFGATAPILALAYLHKTFRFTSVH
jgi:hypothetical protein